LKEKEVMVHKDDLLTDKTAEDEDINVGSQAQPCHLVLLSCWLQAVNILQVVLLTQKTTTEGSDGPGGQPA
jgi:hypothetical protein